MEGHFVEAPKKTSLRKLSLFEGSINLDLYTRCSSSKLLNVREAKKDRGGGEGRVLAPICDPLFKTDRPSPSSPKNNGDIRSAAPTSLTSRRLCFDRNQPILLQSSLLSLPPVPFARQVQTSHARQANANAERPTPNRRQCTAPRSPKGDGALTNVPAPA